MASPLREKIDYIKDRFVNAFWMIRNGKFKLIAKSMFIEVDHRIRQLKTLLLHGRNPDYSKLPGSAYVNRRKVIPPSYSPTHSRRSPLPTLQVDREIISGELQAIRSDITVQDASQS
jgi:hypothetical protein